MSENDSCYHLAQKEFNLPFTTNGELNCGMEIQGSTKVLPSVASSGNSDWDTTLQIAAAAKDTLQTFRPGLHTIRS